MSEPDDFRGRIDELEARLLTLRTEFLSDGRVDADEQRRLDALTERIGTLRDQLAERGDADADSDSGSGSGSGPGADAGADASKQARPGPSDDQQTRVLRERMERACARFPRVLERLDRGRGVAALEQELEIARIVRQSRARVAELTKAQIVQPLTEDEEMELAARRMQIETGEQLLRTTRRQSIGDDIVERIECELARAKYQEYLRNSGQPVPGRLLNRGAPPTP